MIFIRWMVGAFAAAVVSSCLLAVWIFAALALHVEDFIK